MTTWESLVEVCEVSKESIWRQGTAYNSNTFINLVTTKLWSSELSLGPYPCDSFGSALLWLITGRDVAAAILDLISAQNLGLKKRNSCPLVLSLRNKKKPQMLRANLCLHSGLSSVPCLLLIAWPTRTAHRLRLAGAGLTFPEPHEFVGSVGVGLTFLSHKNLWGAGGD